MKKVFLTTCGAILIGLLMISSATAVPKVNSDPFMDIVTDIEKNKQIIEENIPNKTLDLKTRESISRLLTKIKYTTNAIDPNLKLGGIIDLIIKIIQWLINFIQQLIEIVSIVYNLVELIYTLVTVLYTLYDVIIKLIEFIQDLFNPQPEFAI